MVFLPVYDYNQLRYIKRPYVTWALLAANIFIYFLFQSGVVWNFDDYLNRNYGFMPASILANARMTADVPAFIAQVPGIKLFTYMFLHGDLGHLFGNMLFLWVFGDNIEDAMGRFRYFLFYIACGVAAGLAHFLSQTTSTTPLIGASGAISGLLAAYLVLFPRAKVWVLFFTRIPIKLRAYWVLGIYLVFNIFMATARGMDNVAWWAHIGGFAAGIVLVVMMRRPGVDLFKGEPDTVAAVAEAATVSAVEPVEQGTTTAPVAQMDAPTVIVRVDRPKDQP
ncbi:MAG: rhomboid family intramembrane serine protease [Rhizobiales bacterium]|jgi:membrane associated rhomboid family serine protease|nr:rhomboid family intramembrane serine protease [Hyphomicrobiales bacterium]